MHISKLVNQTLATLGSKPTQLSKEEKSQPMSQPSSNQPRIRECESPWGKKWLGLDCYCARIQGLAVAAEKFCGRWFRNDRSKSLLILAGESNAGKSHVAGCIFKFALAAAMKAREHGNGATWPMDKVPSATFVRWPEVVDGFKNGEFGVVDDMMSVDLLVIDDVGAEHDPSKNATNKLCQVLTRREKKFTVITTNIPPENWPDMLDTRVADRLLRNSEIVNLFGLDSYAMVRPKGV